MSDSDTTRGLSSDAIETKFDRIDELVSLLVDDLIEDDQFKELEGILTEDPEMRSRYVQDIQLHCELVNFFRQDTKKRPESPVLSMLSVDDDGSGIQLGLQPPKK